MRPKSKPHPFRFTIFRPNRSKPLGPKPLPPDAASSRTSNPALSNQKNRLGGDENPGNVVSIAIFRHSTTLFPKFLGEKEVPAGADSWRGSDGGVFVPRNREQGDEKSARRGG